MQTITSSVHHQILCMVEEIEEMLGDISYPIYSNWEREEILKQLEENKNQLNLLYEIIASKRSDAQEVIREYQFYAGIVKIKLTGYRKKLG